MEENGDIRKVKNSIKNMNGGVTITLKKNDTKKSPTVRIAESLEKLVEILNGFKLKEKEE